MTEARQMRAENNQIKRQADFRCEADRCPNRDQLLVCDSPTGAVVLCAHHVEQADGRKIKVRPNQWNEAEELREALRKSG